MKIDNIFKAMRNDEKVLFIDSYGEPFLSTIEGVEKDAGGTYRAYDDDGNDFSIDMIEVVIEEKFNDFEIEVIGVYDSNEKIITDLIEFALKESSISFKGVTVLTKKE